MHPTMSRSLRGGLVAVAAAASLTATTAPAGAASTDYNRIDVKFAQKMRAHHLMGIEMARLALEKAEREQTKDLAGRVLEGQRREVSQFEAFLRARGQRLTIKMSAPRENADADTMRELREAAAGMPFEHRWLDMIQMHHFDAIDMADLEQQQGRNRKIQRIARSIEITQTRQAAEMERLQGAIDDPTPR